MNIESIRQAVVIMANYSVMLGSAVNFIALFNNDQFSGAMVWLAICGFWLLSLISNAWDIFGSDDDDQ